MAEGVNCKGLPRPGPCLGICPGSPVLPGCGRAPPALGPEGLSWLLLGSDIPIVLMYIFSVSLLFAVGVSSLLFSPIHPALLGSSLSLHFSTREALGAPQGGKSQLRDMGRGGWSSGWLVQGVGGGGGTMSR